MDDGHVLPLYNKLQERKRKLSTSGNSLSGPTFNKQYVNLAALCKEEPEPSRERLLVNGSARRNACLVDKCLHNLGGIHFRLDRFKHSCESIQVQQPVPLPETRISSCAGHDGGGSAVGRLDMH